MRATCGREERFVVRGGLDQIEETRHVVAVSTRRADGLALDGKGTDDALFALPSVPER